MLRFATANSIIFATVLVGNIILQFWKNSINVSFDGNHNFAYDEKDRFMVLPENVILWYWNI